ncbi:nucleotidyltransferase family protein [Reinekea marinisedimentorum]|uniref:Nitrate reductase n=1 Tax=Reinekea marinisedimentorum TaxID=230495 RepID=A0A4R3HZ96_9GAMM|nr:nucleotidyltransferase family protein [Reinekea marinisedimentorum]TCS38727.1 hypothetical protein BCF53_1151 [Reinekea marinisedimentorum]
MNYDAEVIGWLTDDSYRMEALAAAATLELNDWCLAAGFVRNLIWDRLHKLKQPTPLNDIDLIYFAADETSAEQDLAYEQQLQALTDHPWSVKNQARMHLRNHDRPYTSTADAMSYWVEVETAVGARQLCDQQIEIIAPFGLAANFANTITLNAKRPKPRDFMTRVEGKGWQENWPNLQLVMSG